ncbi:MAG: ATP-binding protein [Nannocystaceae bacterium]
MLIELSVANHRCFRERVTLSMEAEPRLSERDKAVDARNIANTPNGDLLRVVGVYGANASGKSNLLGAARTLRSLVLNSARQGQAGDSLSVDPFRLDPATASAASEFEVVFVHEGVQFRYGLAASRQRVEREWLFSQTDDEDEQLGFERTLDAYTAGPAWQRDESLEDKTRPEALHLSVCAAFNHARAKSILGWFRRMKIIDSSPGSVKTEDLLGQPVYGDAIRRLVRRLDFGIDDVKLKERSSRELNTIKALVGALRTVDGLDSLADTDQVIQKMPRGIVVLRNGIEFDLERDESAGTIKALALAGPLVEALALGHVVVIDELDARLHTLLAKQIVELFQDPRTNPRDAQLVFASHDTNLLTRTLLRRDQLWFVEKSRKTQASDLYSLAELRLEDGKGVRNDARFESDYLRGKYGAIPFFGSIEALLGRTLDGEE